MRRATPRGRFLIFYLVLFLSTLSLRRATTAFCMDCQKSIYFYPRSPCGERRASRFAVGSKALFLSTLSLRRATNALLAIHTKSRISIHALLAESDQLQGFLLAQGHNFYPRSPCGERPYLTKYHFTGIFHFYPRSPCGERLTLICDVIAVMTISIHALLAESDLLPRSADYNYRNISIHALLAESDTAFCMDCQKSIYFYPRSPCGERQSFWPSY